MADALRRDAVPAPTRRERLLLALVLGAINLYALPSLGFGYLLDDYELLNASLVWPSEGLFQRFLFVRPLWLSTYPLVSLLSDSAFAHRLASLLLLNGVVYVVYRLIRTQPLWPLVLAATFFHPSLLFPMSWIAQRSDLLLILFAGLTILYVGQRRGLLLLVLSDLCKGPFVFHNLPYVYYAWRKRSSWGSGFVTVAIGVALLLMVGVLFGSYLNYYALNFEAEQRHGLYILGDRDAFAWLFVLVSRGLKLVEGLFLAFVPFPAFYGTVFLVPALLIYAMAWLGLLCAASRAGLQIGVRSIHLLVLAVFMAIPLAFGTGLRVIAPPLVFLFLGLSTMLRPSRTAAAALTVLVTLNLLGGVLNYHFSDTGCHDLAISDPSEACDYRETPVGAFNRDRQRLVNEIVSWVARRPA